MNVRRKLLGAFLAAAALVAATGGVVLHADRVAARQAAVTEAEQVARGIAKDVAFGLSADSPGESPAPLMYDRRALAEYLRRMHDLQDRDIVVIDQNETILADAEPRNVGLPFQEDDHHQVRDTIFDGRSRVFVERGADHPAGIQQVVVPLVGPGKAVKGAVAASICR